MFKTTIRAQGFFDEEAKSYTLYFNLSRRELFDFAKRYDGVNSFQEYLTDLQDNEDNLALVEFIDDLLGSAYGEREGDRFIKSDIIKDNFINGPQYEVLFEKMLGDLKFAQSLLEGIMPDKLMAQVREDEKYQKAAARLDEVAE